MAKHTPCECVHHRWKSEASWHQFQKVFLKHRGGCRESWRGENANNNSPINEWKWWHGNGRAKTDDVNLMCTDVYWFVLMCTEVMSIFSDDIDLLWCRYSLRMSIFSDDADLLWRYRFVSVDVNLLLGCWFFILQMSIFSEDVDLPWSGRSSLMMSIFSADVNRLWKSQDQPWDSSKIIWIVTSEPFNLYIESLYIW